MSVLRWLVLPVVLAVMWFAPRLGDSWLAPLERLAARFATKKGSVLIAAAAGGHGSASGVVPRLAAADAGLSRRVQLSTSGGHFRPRKIDQPTSPHVVVSGHISCASAPDLCIYIPSWARSRTCAWTDTRSPLDRRVIEHGAHDGRHHLDVAGVVPAEMGPAGHSARHLPNRNFQLLDGELLGWSGRCHRRCPGPGSAASNRSVANVPAMPFLRMGTALLADSRPLEGFVFCVPVAVMLWCGCFPSSGLFVAGPRVVLPLVMVVIFTLAFIGYYNWRVIGNAVLLPHALYQHEYINHPVFFWQRVSPPIRYENPEFERYFNGWVRTRFAPTWANSRQLVWDKLNESWQFYCGKGLWSNTYS